jgi:hypothetical protein
MVAGSSPCDSLYVGPSLADDYSHDTIVIAALFQDLRVWACIPFEVIDLDVWYSGAYVPCCL